MGDGDRSGPSASEDVELATPSGSPREQASEALGRVVIPFECVVMGVRHSEPVSLVKAVETHLSIACTEGDLRPPDRFRRVRFELGATPIRLTAPNEAIFFREDSYRMLLEFLRSSAAAHGLPDGA